MWFLSVLVIALTVAPVAVLSRRIRRRTLTVSDAGLEVQRDEYAMVAGWDQVVGVERSRHPYLIPGDELVLSGSEVIPRGSTGKATTLPASLSGHPATRRIQISLYDKAWRDGPVGAHLRGLATAR
jgi:hypothetical protein